MSKKTPFLALALALLAACSSPLYVRIPVSGGQRLTIDAKTGLVQGVKKEPVTVRVGGLLVNGATKQATYMFSFEFAPQDTPVRVQVEDVSDRFPNLLVDDGQPKLTNRVWTWTSEPIPVDSPALAWLHDIDDGFRVFRLTLVMADGREIVHYRATMYPGFMKAALRHQLGLGS